MSDHVIPANSLHVGDVVHLTPDAATWTAQCQHPIYINMSRLADPDETRRCIDCGETWTVKR